MGLAENNRFVVLFSWVGHAGIIHCCLVHRIGQHSEEVRVGGSWYGDQDILLLSSSSLLVQDILTTPRLENTTLAMTTPLNTL